MCSMDNCKSRFLQPLLIGAVFTLAAVCSGTVAQAQSLLPPDAAQNLTPVPVDFNTVPTSPTPANGIVPPMSIGPAPSPRYSQPAFYPPASFPYDRRPVFVAPPGYGPPPFARPVYGPPIVATPFPPGPVFAGPGQPVPATTNYGPRAQDFGPAPVSVEVRRPSGPANFHLSVGEAFINRLLAQERVDPGPISDFILGAQVTGRQRTVSKLNVDLVPSSDKARIALQLNGDVQTLTTGVTPQAKIDTAGQQQFYAVKEVYFDGVQLTTRHATVFIRARNQTIGAMTPLTGTLFGGFADRIAYRAAERQKSAGEAVARDRLAEKLFPTFDGEVDAQLAKANQQLGPLRRWLDSAKLLPSTQSVWTTDSLLAYEFFLGDPKSVPNAIASDSVGAENGIRLSIHESLLNTLVDRAGLKGYKTTDKKLRELEKLMMGVTGEVPASAPTNRDDLPALPGTDDPEGIVTDIEFDDVDPLTFRLERDRLLVTLKAHFKPAGQALIPPMSVTIPYQAELVGNKIRWVAGKPRVVSQDRTDPTAPQTFVETTIEKIIEADLIPLEFDRTLPATYWPATAGPAPRITSIKSDNGWVNIAID